MPALALIGLLAPSAALLARRRAREATWCLESVVLALVSGLIATGLLGVALALGGQLHPVGLLVGGVALALVLWPWRTPDPAPVQRGTGPRDVWLWIGLALVLLGAGLRAGPMRADLAGRDQGTYVLRAIHTARTGGYELHAELLDEAHASAASRPGPGDLSGLFPRTTEPHRVDRYEGPYRPGFYLADRESGRVVPQFFHLHPTLLAEGGLVLGLSRVHLGMLPFAVLGLLVFWCVARRLWPEGPAAALAIGLLALQPLAIWVARTPLTESLTALLLAGAVLAVLRARDGDPHELGTAAFLLGATAFVRGNAWITAPVFGLLLLLRARKEGAPREDPGRRPLAIWGSLLVGSACLHGLTCLPYVHDELARLLGPDRPLTWLHPLAPGLVAAAGMGALLGLDALLSRRGPSRLRTTLLQRAPAVLVVVVLLATVLYLVLRTGAPEPRPFARLDPAWPLLGPAILVLGALGLLPFARWRPQDRTGEAWLVALASIPALTAVLYARRNLPQLGLYYYGRYLVPELLPALILLAVGALVAIRHRLEERPWARGFAFGVPALGLLAWPGLALVLQPVTLLDEFADTRRGLEAMDAAIPEGAVIVAGGEGWHRGHAENQLGGALELGFGRTVLPYRDRERAYASLFELLVDGPAARGEPAPPVVLLLNEASKPYTDADKHLVAGLDDGLPAPFRATSVDAVTIYLHRLTPVTDRIPDRLALSSLRIAIIGVEVDPAALEGLERWYLDDEDEWTRDRSKARPRCLDPEVPVELPLPPGPAAHRQIVLVAAPGTALYNETWTAELDGVHHDPIPPGVGPRERDTLGPFRLETRPSSLRLRGAEVPVPQAECVHGGLFEVRLLPGAEQRAIASLAVHEQVIAPADDRGFPQPRPRWVPASAVNRFRPGTLPRPEVTGPSLQLGPEAPLRFAPIASPGPQADVVITLRDIAIGPAARLVLRVDDQVVERIDPPDAREGAWQTPARRVPLPGPQTRVELVLEGDAGDHLLVRDVALFAPVRP